MACDGCTDVCTCVVTGGTDITVTGAGSAGDPYVVNASVAAETTFAATSSDGSIDITPAGTAGHTPDLTVDVCAILDTGTIEPSGQLFVQSDDADCIPHRLVAPAPGEVVGYVDGEWGPVEVAFAQPPIGANVVIVYDDPALSPETFTKASYPGLRGIFVEMVGGGAGGGGIDGSGAGEAAVSGGGGSGQYGRVWIPEADLDASESVTVGVGGAGGAAGNNNGLNGGSSQFGLTPTFLGTSGGSPGIGMAGDAISRSVAGGAGGSIGTVYSANGFLVAGGRGSRGQKLSGTQNIISNDGGSSYFSAGAEPPGANAPTGSAGTDAALTAFGAGGSGAAIADGTGNHAGGDGAGGVVIVTVVY